MGSTLLPVSLVRSHMTLGICMQRSERGVSRVLWWQKTTAVKVAFGQLVHTGGTWPAAAAADARNLLWYRKH